jgi:DNA-binding NtrC family response regulator
MKPPPTSEFRFMTTQKFGVVFCHETLLDGDFRGVVSVAKTTPVVVLSRFAEWDHYLAALRAGAFDFTRPAESRRRFSSRCT